MNAVTDFVRALGPARLAAMGAVALIMVGFFSLLITRLSTPGMGVLFSDLAFEDSIAVTKKLEALNVPFEIKQDGALILVPQTQALQIRMKLAEEGLPAGGGVGYELFDKTDSLGATSFVQNINHLRAIEGELARTIRALDRVQSARVHLVLPKRELFARQTSQPSASIVLKLRGSLDMSQIRAIQHLVASAVPGLTPAQVAIIDDAGRLLAKGQPGDGRTPNVAETDERNLAFEARMQREIEDILASVVGMGRVRVRVTADLDYNKVTQTTDQFDPEGQVVRSSQVRSENSNAAQPSGEEGVTVGNELPNAGANGQRAGAQATEAAQKNEEITNYEISRVTKTETVEAGRVRRVSVAVLVDGTYGKDPQGQATYTPRSQAELDQIGALVRSAVGFDEKRGDVVYIANLRFADTVAADDTPAGTEPLALTMDDYLRIAEIVTTLLVALLVLFMVIKPLVRRVLASDEEPAAIGPDGQPVATAPDGTPLLTNDATDNPLLAPPGAHKASDMIRVAKVSGEIQASVIQGVGQLVSDYPQETLAIMREWMQQTPEQAPANA